MDVIFILNLYTSLYLEHLSLDRLIIADLLYIIVKLHIVKTYATDHLSKI